MTSSASETSTRTTEGGAPGTFAGLRFEELEVEGNWGMVTDLRFIPGTSELLMIEKSGRVGHLRLEGDTAVLLGSFEVDNVYSVLDCGLISLALDPDFSTNHLLYVGVCTSQEDGEIRRYTLDTDETSRTGASEALILAVSEADAPKPWHNIGSLGFDPDGTMWALFGDKKVDENGQDASTPLSSLVRLLPDRSGGGGYTPAPDNPFTDDDDASPLVYATGLRSPWKGIRDDAGRYWFGDVGANGVEEINVVSAPGQNFGWPRAEGPCEDNCDGLTDPVTWWPHDGVHRYAVEDEEVVPTNARVAYVGLQVRPPAGGIDDPYRGALDGYVLAGDYCQGYVRGLLLGDDLTLAQDIPLGHLHVPSAWGQGSDGFIYAATFGKCETPNIDEDDPPSSRFVRAVPVFE